MIFSPFLSITFVRIFGWKFGICLKIKGKNKDMGEKRKIERIRCIKICYYIYSMINWSSFINYKQYCAFFEFCAIMYVRLPCLWLNYEVPLTSNLSFELREPKVGLDTFLISFIWGKYEIKRKIKLDKEERRIFVFVFVFLGWGKPKIMTHSE